jgi:hypothetical protein
MEIAKAQDDLATVAIIYRQLGGLYFFLNLPDKARPAFQTAMELGRSRQ